MNPTRSPPKRTEKEQPIHGWEHPYFCLSAIYKDGQNLSRVLAQRLPLISSGKTGILWHAEERKIQLNKKSI